MMYNVLFLDVLIQQDNVKVCKLNLSINFYIQKQEGLIKYNNSHLKFYLLLLFSLFLFIL